MKAAVFVEHHAPLAIHEYPLGAPAPDTAIVSLESSGICGTDLHIWEGALAIPGPVILGHEYLGRVQALGDGEQTDALGAPLRVGDRVAVNVIESCGHCPLCSTGGGASCLHLMETLTYTRSPEEPPHFHGGYAECNISPTRYLLKVPDSLPTTVVAAFLCAGPTVVRGVEYADGITADDHVVVQGAGPVGLFAVLYAKQLGAATVTMVGSGSNPLRLELARALGADDVLDIHTTTTDERLARIQAQSGGVGATLIVEGTGNPQAVTEGLNWLRSRGRYVWAGQYSDRGAVPFPTHQVTFNALQIFGSAQFTTVDRVRYLEFMGSIPEQWEAISRVVTDTFTIAQANEAIARVSSGQAIKAIFVGEAN